MRRSRAFVVVLALVGSVILPARAGAAGQVRIDDEQVVVTHRGVSAVVDRAPFGLRFLDADGQPVLTSVDNAQPPPTPLAIDPWRLPGGGEEEGQPPLYAPVTFTVGEQATQQYPGSYWSTDVLVGAAAGTQFNLVEVTEARRVRDGAELEVATNDPSGRTATVTVTPEPSLALKVSVRFSSDDGIAVTAASFTTDTDESFHGFGGRRNATDQRGEDLVNWLEEFHQRPDEFEGISGLPTLDERHQFPTGPQGAYYVQSMFISSRPYGFWLERDEISRWRMASDRDDAWQVGVAASGVDLTVAPGDATTAIRELTALTGRNPVPPEWALGPGISRAVQTIGGTPEVYEEQVRSDLDAVERYDLPLEHFAIEGWPMLEERGVLDEILQRMRDLDLHPVSYYKAFVGGSEHTERDRVFDDAVNGGHVATTATGEPYLFGSPVEIHKPAALIDVTDPDAVAWYQDRILEGLELGFDGFMQDFGEQTFVDMHFDDGSTGEQMHNRYPVLFHRATAEAFERYRRTNPDRADPWFYVRSGYTGRPGSAAYETTNWGGDNTADWSRASGIGSVIPDMLNRGMGGAYGYATDIGGYIDTWKVVPEELLIRWAQLGSLIPVNRLHGSPVNGTHMPWNYGDDAVEAYRDTIERHIEAQPLIMDLWEEAARTGTPIARPLWLHHPDDPEAREQDQQWLLGPDVLVAPVVEEGATERDVYFPEGCWEHPERGDRHEGPGYETVDAPIELLPYYFRCGTDPFTEAAASQGRPPPAATTAAADRSALPATGGTAGGLGAVALVALGLAGLTRRRD